MGGDAVSVGGPGVGPGFGATAAMELYVWYNAARRLLGDTRIELVSSPVHVTSLDMAGYSIMLMVLDGEMARLWDAPVYTPALRWGV